MEEQAPQASSQNPKNKKSSKTLNWIVGCGCGLLVLAVLCAGGLYWGAGFAKGKLIEVAHAEATSAIEKSQLPQGQIDSILVDLDRLRDAANDNRIDFENIDDLEDGIKQVVAQGAIQLYEAHVLPNATGLTPDEEADAIRQLQRLARGIEDGSIGANELEGFSVKFDKKREGQEFDPEDIKRDIARAKRLVDDAGIPDEPYQVDIAVQFTQVIDGLIQTGSSSDSH